MKKISNFLVLILACMAMQAIFAKGLYIINVGDGLHQSSVEESPECTKALSDLNSCAKEIQDAILKHQNVSDICCNAILDYQHYDCVHQKYAHLKFPRWLKQHCATIAGAPKTSPQPPAPPAPATPSPQAPAPAASTSRPQALSPAPSSVEEESAECEKALSDLQSCAQKSHDDSDACCNAILEYKHYDCVHQKYAIVHFPPWLIQHCASISGAPNPSTQPPSPCTFF